MAGARRTDGEDEHDASDAFDAHDGYDSGGRVYATVSDARLTELLRADTPTAYPALRELRLRHRPLVLSYARLCTVGESAARQLTAQAFALAARETARGLDPRGPWRHRLLLLTGRVAASWAAPPDHRADRLDPGLLARLRESEDPEGPVPPMLDAFRSLPSRVQGLIWYAVVDEEHDSGTAALLGALPQDVAYGRQPAFQALRQACLKTRLARSGNPRCQDFRRLIEEAVHPENPRYSPDLNVHMAHCAHCAAAYEELGALRDAPRTALAEGLLVWGGASYVLGATGRSPAVGGAAVPSWPSSRRLVLASAALGVALVPLLLYRLTSDGPAPEQVVSAVRTPAAPPAVTVTATVSVTASPSVSPSPSPTRASRSPSPTPTSSPSKTPTPSRTPEPPAPGPPGGGYAQVVNAGSGLCLDIRDGVMELGTDVVVAPCTSARTQMWRVDTGRGVLQSYADDGFCLDSRGSTDRGVGIWECSAVHGSNGLNLRFTVDSRGSLRPAVAPDRVVTPYGDRLWLARDRGGEDQRWRAGSAAS
ncbi:ricin-type beta-trefoil lectin domain protein [Streptomyces sp. NPDC057757]|uniref:ricin-type beta-trefoil lectin domain protein n=1 Tax=Streptomyces sp. NPDC057757 TaxID=3346241 RepID=UPI0036AA9E39